MSYEVKINDGVACQPVDPTKVEIIGNRVVVTFSNGSVREDDLPVPPDVSGFVTTATFEGHKHVLADITDYDPSIFATSAQGDKADTAVQPGALLSVFENDLQFPTDQELETTNNNLANHIGDTTNPHGVTKGQVGLGNVDNTSDVNKPVSTAQQNEITSKYNASISYINSKLSNKVDKVLGSRLMTTIEGDKLAEFDEEHYRRPVASLAALQALAENSLFDNERRYVASEGVDYFYDAEAVSGDASPSDQTGGTGFWKTQTAQAVDTYEKWVLRTEGTFRRNMVKDSILDLKALGLLEVNYEAEGKVTYDSTKIEEKIDDKVIETTQSEMDQMITDATWIPGTLYVIPC